MAESAFDNGETAIIRVTITDSEYGGLIDPDAVKISISVGGIVKVDNQPMSKKSAGVYTYDYTTATVGRHNVTITAIQNAANRTTIEKSTFLVI